MTKLIIANAEKNEIRVTNFRLQPLVTWLHTLNFITVAILCLLLLKIYRTFLILYEWLFPFKNVSKCSVILVLGPKNEMVQEIAFQLSQIFGSEIIVCHDLNGNSYEEFLPKKKIRKSLVICSHESLGSREVISELRKRVEKAFGFVDILVVSQVDEQMENNSTNSVLNQLNKQLLVQFWTVMAFLPGMLRRNRGHILSVALGKTSLTNTGRESVRRTDLRGGLEPGRKNFLRSLKSSQSEAQEGYFEMLRLAISEPIEFLSHLFCGRKVSEKAERKGIMRSIHEELLQCNTNVKLTLVESNTILNNHYLPSLSSSVLANLIVRSMWNSNAVVKVPSLPCYLIMLPVLLVRSLLRPVAKIIHHDSVRKP